MADIERLQEVESLPSSNLSHNDAIGAVTERGSEKFPNGDCRNRVLRTTCLETDQVALANVDLGRILDDHDTLMIGDEITEDVEERGFARARASRDEDVLVLGDLLLE